MIIEVPNDAGPGRYAWFVCHAKMGIILDDIVPSFCPELGRKVCGSSFWHLRCDAEFKARQYDNAVAEKRFMPFAMKGRLC